MCPRNVGRGWKLTCQWISLFHRSIHPPTFGASWPNGGHRISGSFVMRGSTSGWYTTLEFDMPYCNLLPQHCCGGADRAWLMKAQPRSEPFFTFCMMTGLITAPGLGFSYLIDGLPASWKAHVRPSQYIPMSISPDFIRFRNSLTSFQNTRLPLARMRLICSNAGSTLSTLPP